MDYKMQRYMMSRGRDMRMPMGFPYSMEGGRDMRDMRDMRNPYGSKGGYVTSRRPGRDRSEYGDQGYYSGEFRGRSGDHRSGRDSRDYGDYGDYNDYGRDYAQGSRDRAGYHDMGDYNDYAPYDYGGGYLSKEELSRWEKKLYGEMEKGECEMLSREKIMKRAKEVGIKYDEFTEDEFVATVLMLYTDYCKTLGKANIDMYIKMAKDFLDDKDAGVKYGEKLTAYYDHVVNV